MKKTIFKIFILTLVVMAPVSAMARVSVHVNIPIPLPPPIIFPFPPIPVVIPETNVYAVPDVEDDIFFSAGWWWRPWEGRWYRSRYHDRGWAHYNGVPSFHRHIPKDWRSNYRDRQWKGHQWQQQRVRHQIVERNWRNWERKKYWERNHSWGVPALRKEKTKIVTRSRSYQKRGHGTPPEHGPYHHR